MSKDRGVANQIRALREARFNESRGSTESRRALQPTERPPSVDRTKPERAGSLGKPEVAPGPRDIVRVKVKSATQPLAGDFVRKPEIVAKNVMKKRKVGRPRIEDAGKTIEATKPWKKLKMSRSTWFRRQAEKRQ